MENFQDLTLKSHRLFSRGEYDESLKILKFLLGKYPNNAKIMHNIAVIEYYASNLTKTDQFKESLKKCGSQMNVNIDMPDAYNNIDQTTSLYNNGIILYYMKQYNSALNIMERLLTYVLLIDSKLAIQILFICIDLHLKIYNPDKAMDIVKLADIYMFGNIENYKEPKASTYSSKPLLKSININLVYNNSDNYIKSLFGDNYFGIIPDKYITIYKNKLIQYKINCHIQSKNMRAFTNELKAISSPTSDINHTMTTYFISENFNLKGHFRESLAQLTQAHNAKNYIKLCEDPYEKFVYDNSVFKNMLTMTYYNNLASNHLSLNKPHLSVFYAKKAVQDSEDLFGEFPDMDNTFDTATSYSQQHQLQLQSLQQSSATRTYNCGKNLLYFAFDRRHEILYNLGIHLLNARKPLPAFDCLIETLQIYHSNPRIWLRLAECCIIAAKGGNEENFSLKRKLQSAVQHIMGYGIHRKTILIPSNPPKSDVAQSPSIPTATLEFATACLKNALWLIDDMTQNNTTGLYNMAPSNPINEEELNALKCSVLACATYIQLSLGEYVLAHEYGFDLINLLNHRGGSLILNYLAHLYVAECLILKDNVREALKYLDFEALLNLPYLKQLYNIKQGTNKKVENVGVNAENGTSQSNRNLHYWSLLPIAKIKMSDQRNKRPFAMDFAENVISIRLGTDQPFLAPFNWTPQDTPSGKLVMHYNLCVCYTLLGEYEKASHMLRNNIPFKSPNDLPSQFIALALYLAIKQGHLDIARMIILQNYSQIQY